MAASIEVVPNVLSLVELALPVAVEPRFCDHCGDQRNFEARFEFFAGRLIYCTTCGEEDVQPFTRTTTEAA